MLYILYYIVCYIRPVYLSTCLSSMLFDYLSKNLSTGIKSFFRYSQLVKASHVFHGNRSFMKLI